MAAFPVEIAPAFGRTFYLDSDPTDDDPWDLNAWIPPDIMGEEATMALEMTSPGLSAEGWHDVWWRGSGHFDDPGSPACRPDDGTSTIDDTAIVLSPADAVEFCRNEFVLDELAWLAVPPTDTIGSAASRDVPSPGPASTPSIAGAIVAGAIVAGGLVGVFALALTPSRRRT